MTEFPSASVPEPRPALGIAAGGAAFAGGVTVMGAEMAFARQVAPWFGSSLPVWAVLISILLLALALGAGWGARRPLGARGSSDGSPLLSGAGAALVLAAWLLPLLLSAAASAGRLGQVVAIGAGVAALALAGCPLFLMGALTPTLVRARAHVPGSAGWVAGRLSALATAGSLVGTLGTVFLALPGLGTRATLLALALVCAVVAALAGRLHRRALLAALALLAAAAISLLLPSPAPALAGVRPAWGVLREARQTPYQAAFVLETEDGARTLRLNSLRERHSHHDPRGPSAIDAGVWPLFLLAQEVRPGCATPPARVLTLGLGAGTLARDLAFAFPRARMVGVEIDPDVVELGRRWFALPAATEVHVEDARVYLERAATPFDLVWFDAFSGAYPPFQTVTRESFARVERLLRPGGAVAVNVLSVPGEDRLLRAVGGTLAAVFDRVAAVRSPASRNTLLLAWRAADEGRERRACARPRHPQQRALVARLRGSVHRFPADPEVPILTDDHAPVEWLAGGCSGCLD
jgi:predicted O-methyltransferase YrrM